MVRAYDAEDGLAFDGRRQGRALATLLEGDAPGIAWLITLAGETVGYVVLIPGFSLESGGRDGFIDELYVAPAARDAACRGSISRSPAAIPRAACTAALGSSTMHAI